MLDARNIYRKVTRAIFDFSPEQQKNIAAIVWLYRGQSDRFLSLVEGYLAQAVVEGRATAEPLSAFRGGAGQADRAELNPSPPSRAIPIRWQETWAELTSAQATLSADIEGFAAEVAARAADWERSGNGATRDNAALHPAREGLHDIAERCRGLTKQIDLVAKLAGRAIDIAVKEIHARESDLWANTDSQHGRARRWRTRTSRQPSKRCAGLAISCSRPTGCRSAFPMPNCAMSKGW